MAENNKPTFSVDDILNEVRAMRGQPTVGGTQIKHDEPPKKTAAEKSSAISQTETIHKPTEKSGAEKSGPKNIDEVSISDALNDIIKKTKPVTADKPDRLIKEPAHEKRDSHGSKKPKHNESKITSAHEIKAENEKKAHPADKSERTAAVKIEKREKAPKHKDEAGGIDKNAALTDELPQKPKQRAYKPNVITADELNGGFEEQPFHVNRKRRPKVITPEEIQKSADSATLQFNPENLKKSEELTPHEKAIKQVDSLYGEQTDGQTDKEFETKAERKERLKQEKILERMRRAEEKEQRKIQKRLEKHRATDEDYNSSAESGVSFGNESGKRAESEPKFTYTEADGDAHADESPVPKKKDEEFDFTDIFKFPKAQKDLQENEPDFTDIPEKESLKSRAGAKAKKIIFGNEAETEQDEAEPKSYDDEKNSSVQGEKRIKTRAIRQKRAKADIPPDDEDDSVIDDYNNIDDAESVRGELDYKLSGISKRSTVTFWLFVISCVFTMLPGFGINLPQPIAPTAHTTVYLMINTLIFAAAIIANAKTVIKGFLSLIKLHPDIDTAVSVSVIASAIQIAVSFMNPQSVRAGEGYLYYSLPLLALYLNLRGKKSMFMRVRSNFETVATTGTKQSCFSMRGKRSAEITDMTSAENVNVVCSRNVLNLHDFLYNSFSEDPADRISRIFAPIGLCLAIVVGGIIYFVKGGNMPQTFGCIAALSAMCVPLCSALIVNKPFAKACKTVKEYGGLLSGYNSVESFHDAEYVVVNDYDLFPSGSIELLNLRAVGDESIDSVVMDAAALVMAAGGPLGDVFDRMIEGRVKSLKTVSSIKYTDFVGLSGNVGGDKIDVGTRAMMENLGEINLPDEDIERKIAKKNCFAVYIARNDNLCGMIVVKYTAKDESIAEQLQKLTDNGVTLLVNSCDPNISEELVQGLFDLNENTVHVMSSQAVMIYEQETEPRESDNSMLAHHNSLAGLCAALNAAKKLTGVISLSVILQTIGVVLGAAVLIYFSFIGSSLTQPVNILFYQLLCSLAVMISSSARSVL